MRSRGRARREASRLVLTPSCRPVDHTYAQQLISAIALITEHGMITRDGSIVCVTLALELVLLVGLC